MYNKNESLTLENFISFCDEMMIANEGKIMDKIKGVINNTINKRLTSKKEVGKKANGNIPITIQPTLTKAGPSDFERLYKTEAMCAEGMKDPDSEDTMRYFTEAISKWDGHPEKLYFYWCRGKDLNKHYHLTGDNQYPDELGIFFIDWSNFGKEFKAYEHKGGFRWFSDVVDNNARREIRKGNKFYENYHSLYGDEWFYSTI